jgi:hypothetical protein
MPIPPLKTAFCPPGNLLKLSLIVIKALKNRLGTQVCQAAIAQMFFHTYRLAIYRSGL